MAKVSFFDRRILRQFSVYLSAIATVLTLVLIFYTIPDRAKEITGIAFVIIMVLVYIRLWVGANSLKKIDIDIAGSSVIVKSGDIFKEIGYKGIGFNEYFDTQVDDIIISRQSLNGIFINRHLKGSVPLLDQHISQYHFDADEIHEVNSERKAGKKQKYAIGTICVYDEYLLTALSKFDSKNQAHLTMPEYLEFLINFWNGVNRVYSQQSVSVPIFGSGITRIKGNKGITDEELLKIMLWTFRISEMRFKYPAKLTIVVHEDKIDSINLFEIQSAQGAL